MKQAKIPTHRVFGFGHWNRRSGQSGREALSAVSVLVALFQWVSTAIGVGMRRAKLNRGQVRLKDHRVCVLG